MNLADSYSAPDAQLTCATCLQRVASGHLVRRSPSTPAAPLATHAPHPSLPEHRPHAHEVAPPGHVVGAGSTTSEGLHERVTKALGWKEGESRGFSLSTPRELVRTVDPALAGTSRSGSGAGWRCGSDLGTTGEETALPRRPVGNPCQHEPREARVERTCYEGREP